jgi:amino acid transporter
LLNFRGVAESVKANVAMTAIELSGLLIVIVVGTFALSQGIGDVGRAFEFNAGADPFALIVSGAGLAFFAIVGFEDSVNLVEETENPQRDFPRAFFVGITITGIVYMLVAFFTTALVPIETLRDSNQDLLEVVRLGAPAFPLFLFALIAMVAVSNTSLINLMMTSRLLYGLARERAVPAVLGRIHAGRRTPWVAIIVTTGIALLLASWSGVRTLGGTTALLLLCVFAVVNVTVLVLRRTAVAHAHYRAPTVFPVLGATSCAWLASPWSGRDPAQYRVAGVLLLVGLALYALTWAMARGPGAGRP